MSSQHKHIRFLVLSVLLIWAAGLFFGIFMHPGHASAASSVAGSGTWVDQTTIMVGSDKYTDANIFDTTYIYTGPSDHGCFGILDVNPTGGAPGIGLYYDFIYSSINNTCVGPGGHPGPSGQTTPPSTDGLHADGLSSYSNYLVSKSFPLKSTNLAPINAYRLSASAIFAPQEYDTGGPTGDNGVGQDNAYYSLLSSSSDAGFAGLSKEQQGYYYFTNSDGTHDRSNYISVNSDGVTGYFHAGSAIRMTLANGGNAVSKLPDGDGGTPPKNVDIGKVTVQNSGGPDAASADLQCSVQLSNPLSWIICPIIDAAKTAVGAFDSAITNELTINVNQYFGDGSAASPTSGALYAAWSSFRYIALALIVVISLVMVISQALSVELFDAYTIRKVLPRLVFAVIAISLSWELCKFAIQFANDLGVAVRTLVEAPFYNLPAADALSNGGYTIVTGGVVAVTLGTTLGIIGIATFMVTALIAVIVAFATLIFRQMLIVLLVVLAPVAIACSILPNTQRVWKMWFENFFKALMLFPLIALFIAGGHAFAKIAASTTNGNGNLLQQAIIFIAYFGPYFMLPVAFRMSGAALAGVSGFAQKVGSSPNAALAKFRKGRREKQGAKWADRKNRAGESRYFAPDSKFARFNDSLSKIADPMNAARIATGSRSGKALISQIGQKRFEDTEKLAQVLGKSGFNDKSLSAIMEGVQEDGANQKAWDGSEAGLNHIINTMAARDDVQSQVGADILRSNAGFLLNAHKSEEYGRANIGAAAGLQLAAQGFITNEQIAAQANRLEADSSTAGLGLGNSFNTNAQLLSARAGGLNKPGYSSRFNSVTGKFEAADTDTNLERAKSLSTQDIGSAKGGKSGLEQYRSAYVKALSGQAESEGKLNSTEAAEMKSTLMQAYGSYTNPDVRARIKSIMTEAEYQKSAPLHGPGADADTIATERAAAEARVSTELSRYTREPSEADIRAGQSNNLPPPGEDFS